MTETGFIARGFEVIKGQPVSAKSGESHTFPVLGSAAISDESTGVRNQILPSGDAQSAITFSVNDAAVKQRAGVDCARADNELILIDQPSGCLGGDCARTHPFAGDNEFVFNLVFLGQCNDGMTERNDTTRNVVGIACAGEHRIARAESGEVQSRSARSAFQM